MLRCLFRFVPVLLLTFILTFASCNKYDGYEKGKKFYYKNHTVNENNPQPETGDFVEINIGIRTRENEISPMTKNSMTVDESMYKGDLYSCLKIMHLGDSTTFILNGPKFYEEFLGMGKYPYGKEPIFADVKMLKIMSKNKIQLAAENYEENKKRMRHVEDSLILDYVAKNHIDVKKSGIYRLVNKKTNGEKPKNGQTVQIIYRMYSLDGTILDENWNRNEPVTFEIGKFQVAHGIEIVSRQIHVGEDVTCVLPSRYAFGESGSDQHHIPPFTPIVYRFELLKIVK